MSKLFFAFLFGMGALYAERVVVPDDYYMSEDGNLSYVYSGEYRGVLPDIKAYQEEILKAYEKEYGYKLDDRFYVGLASQKNQIANAFSTQIPFNSQIFYGAGAGYIDYFCFSSWLKTLLIHETAHNFQLNPKANELSKLGHKVLGNTPFSIVGIFPVFPLPNLTESNFILEGNAVANESRYGNGGRLFSGYALAEVVSLAQAGLITPQLMYNDTLNFPYGEKAYLVGGFFQQFLIERYGIDSVNGYFKRYATQPFPFFTNRIFKEQFGKKFETLLAEFVLEVQSKHQDFKTTQGKVVAKSQCFVPLNATDNEIYTLVGDKRTAPRVLRLDKQTQKISYEKGSWRVGEVFKHNGNYYTQGSAKISPTDIKMGLFDKDGYLLKGTSSKVMQGFKTNGDAVYFDVLKSLENPYVYVNGVFYTETHSSVYVDKQDNLYYFKQEGEKRTLYKNRTALLDYEGHYGFVSDVDEGGNVYFVAPTLHGSSVYRFGKGTTERVTLGDDVIECKVINGGELLVVSMGAFGYEYRVVPIESRVGFNQENGQIFQSGGLKSTLQNGKFGTIENSKNLSQKPYIPLTQLRYSSLNQTLGYGSYNGFGLDVQANFVDPLMQNSLMAIFSWNDARSIAGLHYDNQAHQLEFGTALYGVYRPDDRRSYNERDYGYEGYARLPFLATGYWRGEALLAYTKAYHTIYREPFTLSLDIANNKQFGISKYPNHQSELSLFATRDRESQIGGASYGWMHDLPLQSYIGLKGAYLKSNEANFFTEKGIEISDTFSDLQLDKATVNMPTFIGTEYAKEVKMVEVSLSKVFEVSRYFYSFPLSLRRESVYVKQRLYDIDFTDTINRRYNESVVGVEADVLLLHKIELPLSIEWLYNPDVEDQKQVRVLIGGSF